MERINCWEYKNCGREPGGINVDTLGVCPAAIAKKIDGSFSGKNGGRCCWMVAGTFCDGKVQGTFAKKFKSCRDCDFYKKVASEELADIEVIDKIKEKLASV